VCSFLTVGNLKPLTGYWKSLRTNWNDIQLSQQDKPPKESSDLEQVKLLEYEKYWRSFQVPYTTVRLVVHLLVTVWVWNPWTRSCLLSPVLVLYWNEFCLGIQYCADTCCCGVVSKVCSLEFDRKDIEMNKLVATCLESKLHVFDMRTQHPQKGFASVTEKVIRLLAISTLLYNSKPVCSRALYFANFTTLATSRK